MGDTALANAQPVTRFMQQKEYEEQKGSAFENIQIERAERIGILEQLDQELKASIDLFNEQLAAYQKQRLNIQDKVTKSVNMNAEWVKEMTDKMNALLIKNVTNADSFQDETAKNVIKCIENARHLVEAEANNQIYLLENERNMMLGDDEESTSTSSNTGKKQSSTKGGKRKKRKTKKGKH